MEGIHPPETSQKPPIYESLGPTSNTSLVCWAEFSPVDNLLGIGYHDGLVEVSVFEPKTWAQIIASHDSDFRTC